MECSSVPSRPLTPSEAAGGDILFSVKTTFKYHNRRPREILDTWLQDVDPHNVFFVTDTQDKNLENNLTAGKNIILLAEPCSVANVANEATLLRFVSFMQQ